MQILLASAKIMKERCPAIGEQNRQRFEIFGSDEAEVMPAVLAYWDQAYKHLRRAERCSLSGSRFRVFHHAVQVQGRLVSFPENLAKKPGIE